MQTLKQHQLLAKYSKCEFLLRSVVFLLHIICSEGVDVDPKEIEAVKNFRRPLTPIDIRSFLGITGYYQLFVDGFASIASLLTTLTQKCIKFDRSKACEKNFQTLKDRLTSSPVLTLLEGTKGFVVYRDASRMGLVCMRMQHGKVITYASR